jgi:phenylacetic acid degradation operon negative regulatory protein
MGSRHGSRAGTRSRASVADRGPIGATRKLDASLPGIEASIVEFAGLDLPRFQAGFPPQHLLLTLIGDYLAGCREPVPSAALVDLLGEFEVNPAGARAALSRLTGRGLLIGSKVGRNTFYRAADDLMNYLPHGQSMTLRFAASPTGWNGMWTFIAFSLPEEARQQRPILRSRLRAIGFAPLFDGLWVSPFEPTRELAPVLDAFPEAKSTILIGRPEDGVGRIDPLAAWSFDETRELYVDFLAEFEPLRARIHAGDLGPAEALVARIRAVYNWFVIASTDPDMPVELLPADWPRVRARALFVEVVDSLAPVAEARVRTIFGQFSSELANMVTAAPLAKNFE